MHSKAIGVEPPTTKSGKKISVWRILGALLIVALLFLLPALPEEMQLASLRGRWVDVRNQAGTSPSGLDWEVRGGSGSGGDFCTLSISRKGREVLAWHGNSDELSPLARIYRDESSSEPRFLCYQPLSTGPHTPPSEVDLGTWLIEGETCRPVVTNPISQYLRDPLALLVQRPESPSLPLAG